MLDAAQMSHKAWSQVTETTIVNCFRKAGFVKESDAAKPQEDIPPLPQSWDDGTGVTFEE